MNTAIPAPLSGLDMLKVMWARNFTFDRAAFNQQLKDLIAELKTMKAKGEGAFPKTAKRIIVTGVPTGVGAEKVLKIIEESGAAIVYIENCSGMKQYLHDVATTGSPLDAIADKYLADPLLLHEPEHRAGSNSWQNSQKSTMLMVLSISPGSAATPTMSSPACSRSTLQSTGTCPSSRSRPITRREMPARSRPVSRHSSRWQKTLILFSDRFIRPGG